MTRTCGDRQYRHYMRPLMLSEHGKIVLAQLVDLEADVDGYIEVSSAARLACVNELNSTLIKGGAGR